MEEYAKQLGASAYLHKPVDEDTQLGATRMPSNRYRTARESTVQTETDAYCERRCTRAKIMHSTEQKEKECKPWKISRISHRYFST